VAPIAPNTAQDARTLNSRSKMSEDKVTAQGGYDFNYSPDWDEDQRRGYRAYRKAKAEGKSEREALNLAFKHAQKDANEYQN